MEAFLPLIPSSGLLEVCYCKPNPAVSIRLFFPPNANCFHHFSHFLAARRIRRRLPQVGALVVLRRICLFRQLFPEGPGGQHIGSVLADFVFGAFG